MTPTTGDPQAYHTATLKADGAFSRRWSWELTESGSYGSENARFQAPLTFVVVQTTPVSDASAAVLLRTKNVSFAEGSARAAYLLSARDAIGFTATHTYTGIEGDPTSPNSTRQPLELGRRQVRLRTNGFSTGRTESLWHGGHRLERPRMQQLRRRIGSFSEGQSCHRF